MIFVRRYRWIAAAKATAAEGITAVFTRLGENVKDLAEADGVADHYLAGIDRIRALNLALITWGDASGSESETSQTSREAAIAALPRP